MHTVKRVLQGAAFGGLALLCAAVLAHAQADGGRKPQQVMAVDATGAEIGTVLKMDFSLQRMQVALEVNHKMVPILVGKSSFSHGSRPMAYFVSDNCSGPAFLTANAEDSLGPPVGVAGPRGTLFWGYPDSMTLREIGSALMGDGCSPFSGTVMVMEAEAVLDLADEFTLPFDIAPRAARDGAEGRDGRARGRD